MTKQELVKCIDTYGRDIFSFCLHLTRERTEAEELYQDTWLKVMEQLHGVDTEGNVRNFCLSVAVGLWQNRKRKFAWRRRIAPIQAYEAEGGTEYLAVQALGPEDELLEKEKQKRVWETVDDLPEKLRMVVLLYYMEERTIAQISRIAGIPEGTVKSRLYQARKILEKKLEEFLK